MISILTALALLLASGNAAAPAAASAPSKPIAKIMARGDGASPETAYKVRGVGDEYAIVRALGLEVRSQSLVMRKKAYDVLEVADPRDGSVRQLWFDISRFY
ncbi:MAG: DUF4919 domain-containing protein [Allosphingosinicella sp.]